PAGTRKDIPAASSAPSGDSGRAPPRRTADGTASRSKYGSSCRGLFVRTAEQAMGTKDQRRDHDGVDDEGADLRHVVFARHIGHAEQDGGIQRAQDVAAAPHGTDAEE